MREDERDRLEIDAAGSGVGSARECDAVRADAERGVDGNRGDVRRGRERTRGAIHRERRRDRDLGVELEGHLVGDVEEEEQARASRAQLSLPSGTPGVPTPAPPKFTPPRRTTSRSLVPGSVSRSGEK